MYVCMKAFHDDNDDDDDDDDGGEGKMNELICHKEHGWERTAVRWAQYPNLILLAGLFL
jgi:hypothetical protein